MEISERIQVLRAAGRTNREVAAILNLDVSDVVEVRLGQVFESEPELSTAMEWCSFAHGGANLVSAGPLARQLDLTGATNFRTSDAALFSINGDGCLEVPLPAVYLVAGWVAVAIDVEEGAVVEVLVGVDAEDTFAPDVPTWRLGRADFLGPVVQFNGFTIPFVGMIALPDSQDIGPLKLNLSKSGGWNTTEIGAPLTVTVIQVPGSGAYTT